jgi:hypothetical protein
MMVEMVTPRDTSGSTGTTLMHSSAWKRLGGDIDGEASNDESDCSVAMSVDGRRVASIGAIPLMNHIMMVMIMVATIIIGPDIILSCILHSTSTWCQGT